MAQADLWAQQQAQPDYYTAAVSSTQTSTAAARVLWRTLAADPVRCSQYYGQPPQSWGWQQSSDYEQQPGPGAPPAADEPQPPGQEAEVPPVSSFHVVARLLWPREVLVHRLRLTVSRASAALLPQP